MKMITQHAAGYLCAVAVGLALAAMPSTSYATLFSSDMSSATGWTTGTISADDFATFGYDYSADGIPAPPGGSDTVGLKLESNTTDGVGGGGVTAWSNTNFAGKYAVEFDVWGNIGWGSGTTEYFGGGVGHDQSTIFQRAANPPTTMVGGLLIMVTDASSSRDYRMFKDGTEQDIASGQYAVSSNDSAGGDFDAIAPSVDLSLAPLDVQGQTDITPLGGPAFNWHHIKFTVDSAAGTAQIQIDSVDLGTLDANIGSSFPLTGAMSLTHQDTFGSIGSPAGLAFSIYDNVEVTRVPEPASIAMLGLGSLGLALIRRRK